MQKGCIGKYILRQIMENILPAKIKNRFDKMGFASPESVWARGDLNDFYREELSKLREIPLIKSEVVLKSFEKFTKGLIPYDSTFTRLINFQRWLSIFKISI
jgi:asparagine synthase (glutamine-hydrolysing)